MMTNLNFITFRHWAVFTLILYSSSNNLDLRRSKEMLEHYQYGNGKGNRGLLFFLKATKQNQARVL